MTREERRDRVEALSREGFGAGAPWPAFLRARRSEPLAPSLAVCGTCDNLFVPTRKAQDRCHRCLEKDAPVPAPAEASVLPMRRSPRRRRFPA